MAGAVFFSPSSKCLREGLVHHGPRTLEGLSPVSAFLHFQSTDEFSELSFRISELAREPRGPRERREDGSGEQRGHGLRAGGVDEALSAPLRSLTCPALSS